MILSFNSNRIVKNATWIIGCRAFQAVFNLIVSMIIARFLGPSNFGIINYAESIATFVLPIMQLGFSNTLVLELVTDREKEGEILGTVLASCFVSGVICISAVVIFTEFVNHGEKETILVCLLYSFMLLAHALEMLMYWFEAHLISQYTSIVSLIAYVIVSAYKIYLVVTGRSIYWFAISNTLDYMIIAICQIYLYKRLGGSKLEFSFFRFKKMFNDSKYYIISGLMIAVFSQTDRIMLKLMVGNDVTGYYSAAVRCAGLTTFVFSAIISSSSPVIYESFEKSEDAFERNIQNLYSVILYMAFAQSMIMTLFAKPIILILYGSAYIDAVPALQIITWYIAFSYMGTIRNRWMLAKGIQHLIWKIDLAGALINVVLNMICIPKFGIIGAATASLVTQMFTNFVLSWLIKDVRRNNDLIMNGLNPKSAIVLLKDFFD